MPALSGDGIKITAVGFSDFGESSNGLIERCWIDGLNGKGINIVGDVSSEFVASHIIIRHNSIFYCNTGIYSELSEQVEIDNNQIIGNTNYGIVIGYDGRGVSRLITITHNELGNNNLLGSIWIQAVVTGVVEGNRFVNNLTETFGNQLTTGKADGSGPVRNLTIQRNYIVQANPNLAGHYQFFIHPGYSNNISILDNYKIVLASGGLYNDISRINILREIDEESGLIVNEKRGASETVILPNPTNLVPKVWKSYRATFTASTDLVISPPTEVPQEKDEFYVALFNNSASPITVNITTGSGFILGDPIVFSSSTQYEGFILMYKYLAGNWYRVK
ncbi:right-handed parallel beta-helix repeat-containing protein [Salmonirosea aquatica]